MLYRIILSGRDVFDEMRIIWSENNGCIWKDVWELQQTTI